MVNYKELSDEEIVDKIRTSDQSLYRLIIDRYREKLFRYANNLIKDQDKAADAVQETFIKAFINLNSFKAGNKFSSWIYRITHNETINIIRKYHKDVVIPEGIDFKSDENIEADFEKKEINIMVEKCLKGLPIIYSEPLTLQYIEDKTHREISDILRIPMGTVAVRINRAKKIMKVICQKI
jgi:RNA polymerase sigma-70 factor, ECF subfamily